MIFLMKRNTHLPLALACLAPTFAQAQTVDYDMLEKVFGDTVITSVTGKPMLASDAPADIEIITQEDIKNSGAYDIPGVLKGFAGIEVERPYIGHANVYIRGYNQGLATRVLVLLNGRELLLGHVDVVKWDNVPVQLSEIRQIEVIKGPASAIYGFNAESGVINIITYSPLNDDIDEASVSFGNRQYQEGSLASTIEVNDDLAFRVSGGVMSADGFNRDSFEPAPNKLSSDDAWVKRAVNLDVEWQANRDTSVRMVSNIANYKAHDIVGAMLVTNSPRDLVGHHLNVKRTIGDGVLDVNIQRQSFDSVDAVIGVESDLTDYKASYLTDLSTNLTSRSSLEHRYSRVKGTQVGGSNEQIEYNLYAVGQMLDWRINSDWQWVNAVRYDGVKYGRNVPARFGAYAGQVGAFARHIEETTFNSILRYEKNDKESYRVSFGRGSHIPNLAEFGTATPLVEGDPTLQPEYLTSLEFGYHYNDRAKGQSFKTSLFYNKMENVLTLVPNGVISYKNCGESDAMGIELTYKKDYEDFSWGAAYTGINVDDEPVAGGDLFFSSRQAEHQISLDAQLRRDQWRYNTDIHYVSGRNYIEAVNLAAPFVQSEELDGYFTVNAQAAYEFDDRTRVSIDGYNLFDKHREVAMTNSAILGGAGGGNTLGRLVRLTLTHKF